MSDLRKILDKAIDELNELREDNNQIKKSRDCLLIGPNGILDSLSTATFMLSIENQIERDLGKQIDMTSIFLDDEILSKDWKLKEIETWINEKI